MPPSDLLDYIQEWAASQEYEVDVLPHGSEFCKVLIRDPDGGHTLSVIPNPHKGRRLKKHQIRYTVQDVNKNWED